MPTREEVDQLARENRSLREALMAMATNQRGAGETRSSISFATPSFRFRCSRKRAEKRDCEASGVCVPVCVRVAVGCY